MLHKLSFALLFAVLTCGQIASAQVTQSGKCPNLKPPENFSWPLFQGVWYEYSRYFNNLEVGVECVNSHFTTKNNNILSIKFSSVNKSNQIGTYKIVGKVLGPGLFVVTVNKIGRKQIDKVLGTDYKSWAVLYSCNNVGADEAENAWVLTRERKPNQEAVDTAMALLNKNGISTKHLKNTRQHGCPY